MATTPSDIRATYPLPVYNFRVEIGADSVAFAQVSGLNIGFDTTLYRESPTTGSQPGPVYRIMPAQPTTTTLTLTKGVVPAVSVKALYGWISGVRTNQVDKRDVVVRLCDETGATVVSWLVQNAFPVRLDAQTFDATSNDAAIETLQLVADGVRIREEP
jgi:phage tail-like protein